MTRAAAVLCIGALVGVVQSLRAVPQLPVARAPFARTGAVREPVKMVVKPFPWKTNLWDGVEFVSGSKRIRRDATTGLR